MENEQDMNNSTVNENMHEEGGFLHNLFFISVFITYILSTPWFVNL